ncbi:glycosyltransferase family 2 protein [Lysinibacillus sp. SGAir0095]|uniref:glycosyltransferase family 2 protein n=1 Tax=Lysinibacillus sp. SGAir0095 TaxID=2070463 RepID=UPI0010CD4A76|nr:glycosyltransferase family 2 protein [Lysinibacillus sp. SGAir0095]QCR33955.1 glycosyltransferase family 2 protein [Lysinibacillus sp. SGAir0095]
MSLVTVVVPTYNKEQYIKKAVESIYAQTYKNWELLVIDDGSTDNTLSVIKRITDPKNTKIISRKKNEGICHVLNEALDFIQSDFFIQVDGDDWIEPETINVLLNEMDNQPANTALAYGNTIHWHENNGVLHFHKKVKHRSFKDRYEFVTYDPMVQPRFYRTSCVRNVGGWEIDSLTQGRMMEDRRMLLRLLDKYNFLYVDKDLYNFRYHQSNLSLDQNAYIYNQLRKLETEKALLRWGDEFEATTVGHPDLWQSIKLIPKQKE